MYVLMGKFAKDKRGHAAMMLGILAFPLLVAVGFSVDYAQTSSKRSELQNISDAVALAVVKGMPISNIKAKKDGEDLYEAMMAEIRTGLISDSMAITFENNRDFIAEVEIEATAQGTFGEVANLGDIRYEVSSKAINQDPKVEIALAVDVSWSMDDPRMAAVKVAMDEFLNIVEAEVSSDGIDARVSIIPFAGSINLPPSTAGWWDGQGVNNFGYYCVEERDDDDHRVTTTTPREMPFPPYARHPKNCPTIEMLPLTTNMLAIRNHVRDVGNRPRGPYGTANFGTSIHRAAAWVNRALDPDWYSYLSGTIRPTESNGAVRKFTVIMTDGNLYNGGSWAYDPLGGQNGRPTPTADIYFREACDNLRLSGIDIFTVGFKTNSSADAKLRECANAGQFLKGNDTTQLISAFRQIAGTIGGKTPRLLN